MRKNEPIRLINEAVFQETNPPSDRSKPLEWRRSFNTVNFELKKLKIDYVYSVNDVNHFTQRHSETTREPPPVTAAAQRRLRISAKVPQQELRDSIFCTSETPKGSTLYELVRTKDDFHLTVVESPPSEPRSPFAAGAYAGLAFRANSELGEDCLYIEVGAPGHQIEELVKLIERDKSLELHMSVALQSFSFEVDDALREWYHPRELFIHESAAPAALLTLRAFSPTQEDAILTAPQEMERAEEVEFVPQKEPQSPATDLRPFLGIKTALWVIAVLMLFHLFK